MISLIGLLSGVNKLWWYVGAAAIVFASGAYVGYRYNNVKFLEYKNQQYELILKIQGKAQEIEKGIIEIKRISDEQNKIIDTRSDDTLKWLRDRPTRSSKPINSALTETITVFVATGSELSREDAEFLERESTRAERIKEEVLSCYRQYEEVRQQINNK
jgi:hypothetical protein